MIPDGWVLVPRVPSDRMLTEFSGVWAPWLPANRRELELKAYDAMLAVVPSAPLAIDSQVESLKADIKRKSKIIRYKDSEINRAYKKLKNAFDRIRRLEAENEALRSMGGRDSGPEQP